MSNTAIMTVAGIYLSQDTRLNLRGGVLAANPKARAWWDGPDEHPAHVVPEGQDLPFLQKIG